MLNYTEFEQPDWILDGYHSVLFPLRNVHMYCLYLMIRTVGQDQDGVHEVHCSRERSRAAWKIIEEVAFCHF